MIAAWTYTEVTDVGASNLDTNFVEYACWAIVTGAAYAGYWSLNDYFLTYYVIEEIIHDTTAEEATTDTTSSVVEDIVDDSLPIDTAV